MAFMGVLRCLGFAFHISLMPDSERRGMDSNDLEPRKKKMPDIVLGEDISTLSAHELQARITCLEEEIARCREAIKARTATRSAAEGFFKR
jgi:uncharacterized small protein (DUF1192 family)